MAYRTYVKTTGKKSIQILGNNEYYEPFIAELKRQGIKVDEDGIFSGKIKELQPIIDILEQYIWDKKKEVKEIWGENVFDMSSKREYPGGLTFDMMQKQENAYIFVTANLVNYLKENIEMEYDLELKKYIFNIKKKKEIWFEAY